MRTYVVPLRRLGNGTVFGLGSIGEPSERALRSGGLYFGSSVISVRARSRGSRYATVSLIAGMLRPGALTRPNLSKDKPFYAVSTKRTNGPQNE